MYFRIQPSLSDVVEALNKQGHNIDMDTAKAFWDTAQLWTMADDRVRPTSEALFKRLSPEMWADVRKKLDDNGNLEFGSMSEFLEAQDPTEPGSRDEQLGIDAFSRMVSMLTDRNGAQIRIASDLSIGASAHSVADFMAAGPLVEGSKSLHVGAVLLQELWVRAYREGGLVGTARFKGADLFYASNGPLWPGLNPTYLMQPIVGQPRLRTPLLPQMLAIRSVVKSDTFKWPVITNQAAQSRMRRVAEGAALPIVELTVSSAEGKVYKFGIALRITDEAARRTPIDWLRFHAARIGQQNALDKEQVCFEAAVAAGSETDISTLQGGVGGQITSEPLDDFLGIMEEAGFPPTICIGKRATTTTLKNATTGTVEQSVFRGNNPIMTGGGHPEELDHPPIYSRSYGVTDKLAYMDGSSAMGEATEAGSDKQETDRDIITGTNILTISEVNGYFPVEAGYGAVRLLDTAN